MKPIIVLCFIFLSIQSFSQHFEWARQFKGTDYGRTDRVNDMVIDSDGNTYIFGNTESTNFDLDPTINGEEIIEAPTGLNIGEIFLVKLDVNGNYLWGKVLGERRQGDVAYELKIGTDGNLYALASIQYMDTGANVVTADIKLLKIHPNGNILSTISIPQSYGYYTNNNLYPSSFDLDVQNNIYIGGYFSGTVTLQNNAAITVSTTAPGSYFMLKLENNGNALWIRQYENVDTSDYHTTVFVNSHNDINILLQTNEMMKLYDINALNGNTIWQKEFVGQVKELMHITNDEIIISAHLPFYTSNQVDVNPGTDVVNTNADVFLIFLDYNGNFITVKEFFSQPDVAAWSISAIDTDSYGRYHLAGFFSGTVDFDPSENVYNLHTNNNFSHSTDGFYLTLDSNKYFERAIAIGNENPHQNIFNNCSGLFAKSLKVFNDDVFMAGNFAGVCDFDPSSNHLYSLNSLISSTVNLDGYLFKLKNCISTIPSGDANQAFCAGSDPTISSLYPNSTSINWYDSLTSTTSLAANTPLINGHVYYATTQVESCPESLRLAVTVTMSTDPAPPVIQNQSFCESQNATLADINSDGQAITWYSNALDTTILPVTTRLTTTTYYAARVINGCESSRLPVVISVNSVALPTAPTQQNFCFQQSSTVSTIAANGQDLKWYDTATGPNIIDVSTIFTATTTVYVSQTVNGCESRRLPIDINITQTSAPTGSTLQKFCAALNPKVSNLDINGSNIIVYNAPTAGVAVPANTPLVNGNTYYVSQTLNGCESVIRHVISVLISNGLNAFNHEEIICDSANDRREIVDLSSFNPLLIADNLDYSFNYFESEIIAINNDTDHQIGNYSQYVLETNRIIYVVIKSQIGCSQIVKLDLKLVNSPEIEISDTLSLCDSEKLIVDAGSGFDSYLWSDGSTSSSLNIVEPGNYSIKAGYDYGTKECFTTKFFTVTNSGNPEVTAIDIVNQKQNSNNLVVTANGTPPMYYSLDNEHYYESAVFNNLDTGSYTVYVKNGCGIISKHIDIFFYPSFFTPNGDDKNDGWFIKYSTREYGIRVYIYDRYGKLVSNLKQGEVWDGTYKNQNLPATDYWFVAEKNGKILHKGHFSLIR